MNNRIQFFLRPVFFMSLFLLVAFGCKGPQSGAAADTKAPEFTYAGNIQQVMEAKCTPCHFPDRGKKKFLDTYAAVSTNIDDIMMRVQLPTSDLKFMPYELKKPALTPEEIAMFKTWVSEGMPK